MIIANEGDTYMTTYECYQQLLGPIPKFLEKYLTLDILLRLMDISLECGMDYASKHAYDISFFISRFDHSLSVALHTWRLTHDKCATLAALFHDVATPVFSHVIDYMNGDTIIQESTEEKTLEILRSCHTLQKYLKMDGIELDSIIDFKNYSVVDLERPKMCADRLDNIIAVGLHIVHTLDFNDVVNIINSTSTTINEDGEEEICFSNLEASQKIREANDAFNQLTHSKKDNYMMLLLSKIVKKCLNLSLLQYDDLFKIGEHDMMDIIENNSTIDFELQEMWYEFKTITNFPHHEEVAVKNKVISPLVLNERLF